ncbi:hypothetical protein FGO68_gene4329 [Halteria grandinella]|uniref:Uncharacterized protein n=1 Tax=Halteria grandinella TaxID=5974 RepID=A0A8J8SXX2_HALGN|nr:hypothetical protein FGO68_gene4329 [Halteria grandinella]
MNLTENSFNNAYYSSNGNSNQSTESKIDIKGNIFTHFNLLKKRDTDLIEERNEQAVGTVNSTSLQK